MSIRNRKGNHRLEQKPKTQAKKKKRKERKAEKSEGKERKPDPRA